MRARPSPSGPSPLGALALHHAPGAPVEGSLVPIAVPSIHCLPASAQAPTPPDASREGLSGKLPPGLPGSCLASGGAQTKSQVHLSSPPAYGVLTHPAYAAFL